MSQEKFRVVELFELREKECGSLKEIMNCQRRNLAERKLQLNPSIVKTLTQRLNLEFLIESPATGGEVCFSQSPEVRDAFKTFFTGADLLNYISAVAKNESGESNSAKDLFIPYPNPDTFWELIHKMNSVVDG